ncbi:sortase [Streptomyces bobili]|uniref:sortase n=1 Tax=Streptomyces bobili TaxID=67280 RepID=UPI0036FBA9D3
MGSTHVGVGIGLVVGVLVLQGPVAAAAGESRLDIHSRPGSSGTKVTVSTTACGAETYGKGQSDVAGAFHLLEGKRKGVLTGQFVVPEGTEATTDTVTVKCPPRVKLTESYALTARRPHGAVEAGFGDTDDTATQLAVGGVLMAAGAAGWLGRVRHRSQAGRT